jgi:hypothetical protein
MTHNSWRDYLIGILAVVGVLYFSVDLIWNLESKSAIDIFRDLLSITMGSVMILLIFAREKAEKIPGVPEQKD